MRFEGICIYKSHPDKPGMFVCEACGIESARDDDRRLCPAKNEFRRPLPSVPRMAWNLATAVAQFAADMFRRVSPEQYGERLRACDGCRQPEGYLDPDSGRCTHPGCGCFIQAKAVARAWTCPIGRWPEIPKGED